MADEEKPGYFYRLVCLVVDLGTEGLWKVFLKEIHKDVHGQTTQSFLVSKKRDIDMLKKKKILNDMQYTIVKKEMSEKNESKFDISLLYVLIRNLTKLQEPVGGWDTQCLMSSDESPGANIFRLKMVRNEAIAHKSKCSMKKSEFETFWAGTEEALLGLARYYGEEDIMKKKIDQVEKKELIEGERDRLDKLLKWKFEEKCTEMITKIEELNQKIAKHDSVPEDISSLKAAITSIQEQLNLLGMNSSLEGQLGFESRPGGPQTSELDAMKNRIGQMENNILQSINEMLRVYSAGNLYFMQQTDSQEPPIDNPNALKDDEIKKYSEELGRDWEIFAVYLGYRQVQIDIMKQTYPRQIEALLHNMLKKWHDVVARCGENPKKLLAAAFTGIRDNRTAYRILRNRELVEEVKRLKPKPETEEKIQKIKFQSVVTTYMYGGPVNQEHSSAVGGTPHQFPEPNICRAEGVGNSMASNAATTRSNLYRRQEDLTLSETVAKTLTEFMKSVGCLVMAQHGVRGTVFRVGDRYVITAFHVIEPITDELYSQSFQVSANYSHPVVFVNFNECPTTPPQSIYQLKPPCFKDAILDIAILEIDNPDNHLPQPLALCKLDKDLSKVSCITYGHPGSSNKHLDPNCDVLQSNSNQVVTAIEFFMKNINEISQALTTAGKSFDPDIAFSEFNDASGFLLNSSFEHGGSGGPAIDHSRPLSCEVVGIFLKGYPTFFYDLQKEDQMKYGAQHQFEMCRKTSSLYTALQSHDIELANNIFH